VFTLLAKVEVETPVPSPVLAKVAVEVTSVPFGLSRVQVIGRVVAAAPTALVAVMIFKSETIAVPTVVGASIVAAGLAPDFEKLTFAATMSEFAGTTDKSPNPSEATATADTFFNEIVFTIFLSFSQIKEFLLPGW
jgi:hypothetical protein